MEFVFFAGAKLWFDFGIQMFDFGIWNDYNIVAIKPQHSYTNSSLKAKQQRKYCDIKIVYRQYFYS